MRARLSPADLQPTASEAQVRLGILDGLVVLRGPREFEGPWRTLWKPFLMSEGEERHGEVLVRAQPAGYSITSPGRDVNVIDGWRVLVETRNDAVRLGLSATSGVIDLHGAVLVREEQALLLLGDAWAGKTTMALALVERGWRYYSDDLAVIGVDDGLVRPIPKPPGVKAYPWRTMRHFWDPLPLALGEPTHSFVIPPPFQGSLDQRARPAWVAHLVFRKDGEAEITHLTAGQALAGAGQHLGDTSVGALTALARVTSECVNVQLTYGNADEAVGELEDLVI